MPNPVQIIVPRSTDREYLDIFLPLVQREDFKFTKATVSFFGGTNNYSKEGEDWSKNFRALAAKDAELFDSIRIFFFEENASVRVHRRPQTPDKEPPYWDDVSISLENNADVNRLPLFSDLVAEVQKATLGLSRARLISLGSVDVQSVIEQQQASLLEMQRMTGRFARDIAEATKKNEDALQALRVQLNQQTAQEREQLAADHRAKLAEVAAEKEEVQKQRAEIDDLEARSKRRKIYDDIVRVLSNWEQKFDLTSGTSRKRGFVHAFSILAILVLTSGTAYFFQETMKPSESTAAVVFVLIRQFLLTGLLATMAILYFRFLSAWFQQRASEEFRNKRQLLDVHRANWFAELAFQWRKDHEETMPHQIVERMTHHLFDDPADEHATEKLKSLLKAKYLRLRAGDDFEMEINKQSKPPEKSEK